MSLFAILILFLIGYFLVWPLVRVLLRVNAARRQYRDMMDGVFGARSASRGSSKPQPPKRRRKKIPDDTGEYVAFEEVACNVRNTARKPADTTDFTVEQQIVDAEWEDIK